MSEKGRWSGVKVLAGDADVVAVVVVVVEGLSRERDLARGVRCVIRRCWGGIAVGGRVGEEVGCGAWWETGGWVHPVVAG